MWEIILNVGLSVIVITMVLACVCGRKRDSHKSELGGMPGVVKLRLEEEAAPPTQVSPVSGKRVSSQKSHRSLPEIPPTAPIRQDSGDADVSSIYDTIINPTLDNINSANSSVSGRQEPNYVSVQDTHRPEEQLLVVENHVGEANASLPLLSGNGEAPLSSTLTASSAINGQVSSSQDLPYITPPIATSAPSAATVDENNQQTANQYFSGDSDQTKGYTKITVREPINSIRANTNISRGNQPQYGSDDSDGNYAAIEDQSNRIYTSISETYIQMQIPPNEADEQTVTDGPVNPRSTIASTASTTSSAHAYDGLDGSSKRSSAGTSSYQSVKHSRQASNPSHGEPVTSISSPKTEKKRQANSPLPPPPSVTADLQPGTSAQKSHSPVHHTKHSKHKISSTGNLHDNEKLRQSLNEKHQRNNSCVSSSDFYGCNYPVDKFGYRYSSGDLGRPLVVTQFNCPIDKPPEEKSDAIYNTIDGANDIYSAIDQEPVKKKSTSSQPNITGSSPVKNVEEMYAKVNKRNKNNIEHRSQPPSRLSNYDEVKSSDSNHSNGVQMRKKTAQYEEDRSSWNENKRHSSSSMNNQDGGSKTNLKVLNVQSLNKDDPGYETIDRIRNKNHGYETVNKATNKSDRLSDPGYETVKEFNKNEKKLKAIPTVSGGLTQYTHGNDYKSRASPINEPGYETVPSGPDSLMSNDPGYEHIRRERYVSDSDPNYEVLRSRNSTPPYASIRNKPQGAPEYSVVNKKSKSSDPNWISNNNDNFSSEPNYESMPQDHIYNNSSGSDPNYESVGPKDPNYESVKYFDGAIKDPPYEKVKHESGASVHRSNSSSSYERVKSILKHDRMDEKNDNRTNGSSLSYISENAPVADYFQV